MPSTVRKAQTFAVQLVDPFAPTLCPRCFALFALEIEPEEKIAPLLHTKCHGFWTALMIFVSSDWTAQRQESIRVRLGQMLSHCSTCKPTPGGIVIIHHRLPDAECFFGILYQFSCCLLHFALINPIHGYKGLGRKPWRWPTTAEQLFPFGIERTVGALVAQIRHRSAAHTLLHNMMCYHRALVFPILSQARNRAVIISTYIHRLTTYTSAALAKLGDSSSPTAMQNIRQEYVKLAYAVMLVVCDIVTGPGAQPDDQAQFCNGYEVRLFRALHDFISLVAGNEECFYMRHLASKLWLRLSLSEREEAGCPAPPTYSVNLASGDLLDDPYCALHYFLRNRRRTGACCNNECTTSLQYESVRLSLCGKCRVASYCSQRCQRADWIDDVLPHKDVCDALQELRLGTSLDTSMTSEQFSAACHEHQFPLAGVDTLIVWATQGRVGTHFQHGGESMNQLLQPLDHFPPAQPADGRRVYVKIAGGNELVVNFPPSDDGSLVSDREIHKAMSYGKAVYEAMGLPVSWRTCQLIGSHDRAHV